MGSFAIACHDVTGVWYYGAPNLITGQDDAARFDLRQSKAAMDGMIAARELFRGWGFAGMPYWRRIA